MFRVQRMKPSYLHQHCTPGLSVTGSVCPPCSSPSRCWNTGTRTSRDWVHSLLDRAPHTAKAWEGWHPDTAVCQHSHLETTKQSGYITRNDVDPYGNKSALTHHHKINRCVAVQEKHLLDWKKESKVKPHWFDVVLNCANINPLVTVHK